MASKVPALLSMAAAASVVYVGLSHVTRTQAQSTNYDGTRSGGSVAAQLSGRGLLAHDQSVQMVGYFTAVPGLTDLFAPGGPGEATARLTFRSTPFRLNPVGNGSLVHLFTSPVEGPMIQLEVFTEANPNQDFARPDTFSDGTKVAAFRVHSGMTTAIPPAYGVCYTGLELLSSSDFTLGGVRLNLASLGRAGTLNFVSTPPELSGDVWRFPFAIPFSGTVTAVQ